MKQIRKRLGSLLLALCMVLTLLPAVTPAARAATANDLETTIEAYTGGTGTLNAEVEGSTVTVTGSVTGATGTLVLNIDSGVTVVWEATLTAADNYSANLIGLSGKGAFEVATGGTVSATTGIAIYATGANAAIEVSGGTVSSSGIDFVAIYADGANSTVTVNGTGKVSATGNNGVAIYCKGTSVSVADSAEVSATMGRAIYANGASTAVTVSGGTVSATGDYGKAINAEGTNFSVTVNGGTVSATGIHSYAINTEGTSATVTVEGGTVSSTGDYGKAINAEGESSSVTVKGGMISATGIHGYAIYSNSANAVVMVSGGTVFGYGATVCTFFNSTAVPVFTALGLSVMDNGVVLAWNQAAGTANYIGGTETDLTKMPSNATVSWAKIGDVSGISYADITDTNTGFIPVSGVTVTFLTATTAQLTYTIPTNHAYTGAAQGIGTVTPAAGAGAVTVYYESTDGSSYPKSTAAPTDAGTYTVTADVAKGDDYGAASNLTLGTYTIAKAELTINSAAMEGKTYDGSVDAKLHELSFVSGSPKVTIDYNIVSAVFDSADAGTNKTITVTIMLTAQGEKNYSLAEKTHTFYDMTINQAVAITSTTDSAYVRSGQETSGATYTLPTLPSGATWGAVTTGGTTEALIDGTPTVSGNTLTFSTSSQTEDTSATITVALNGGTNYLSGSFTLTVTAVNKTPVTITGVSVANKTYDGAAAAYTGTPGNTQGYNGTYEYVWATSGGTNLNAAPKDAGSYTLTVKIPDSNEEYMGKKIISFTILPKALTVKPQDLSIYKGAALPTSFTLLYVGLVSGDTITPIGTPTYELQNSSGGLLTSSATNGSYTIAWSNKDSITITAANYTVTKADGTLTISSQTAHSGGTGSGSSTSTVTTPIVSGGTATTTVKPTVTNGAAAASVTSAQVTSALEAAKTAAAKSGEKPEVEITLSGTSGASKTTASIPKSSVASLVTGGIDALTITSSVATVSFDAAALSTINSASAGTVSVTAAKVAASTLPSAAQTLVGDRPVYDFSVTSGGSAISSFGGTVTVSIPYTPAEDEETGYLVVYYISDNGSIEPIENAQYDEEAETMVFTTTHFSQYAVGYAAPEQTAETLFSDVQPGAWYYDAVNFLAEEGIAAGTTDTTFSPDATLTRGQFITLLLRAYDIAADENPTDNFSDAGDTYYTGYLAAAKRLGISSGVGDNKFAPEQAISRQQMFTLLYNALKVLDQLPEGDSGKTLSDFTDNENIASYAQEAMTYLVEAGVVGGNNGYLLPESSTTRAQMAQVLYNLIGK